MSINPANITPATNPSQHFTDHARVELHRLVVPVDRQLGSSVDGPQLGAATFDLAALPDTTPSPAAFLLPASAARTEAFAGSAFPAAEAVQPAAVSFLFPVYFLSPGAQADLKAKWVAADAAEKAKALATIAAAMPPAKTYGTLLHAPDSALGLTAPGFEVQR